MIDNVRALEHHFHVAMFTIRWNDTCLHNGCNAIDIPPFSQPPYLFQEVSRCDRTWHKDLSLQRIPSAYGLIAIIHTVPFHYDPLS